jgi:hypothetical protein
MSRIIGRNLWEVEIVHRRGLDDAIAHLFVTTPKNDVVEAGKRFNRFTQTKAGERYRGGKVLHIKHLGTIDA